MKTKLLILFLSTMSISLESKSQVGAVVGGVSAAIAGNEIVKNIIDKLHDAANQLMDRANSEGNALLGRMANELNSSIINANELLKNDLEKAFDHIDVQNSRLLTSINQFSLQISHIAKDAFNIKDQTILDIKGILGSNLPFGKTLFYVQRVDGIVQMAKVSTDYKLDILGIGFGFNSDKLRSKITSVSVNGNTFDSQKFAEVKTAANRSVISISASEVNKLLNLVDTRMSQIKVIIKIKVESYSGFIAKSWKGKEFELPLTIAIIPRFLFPIKLEYLLPQSGYVTINENYTFAFTSPDNNSDKKGNDIPRFTYDQIQPVPNLATQRFERPKQVVRVGEGCPWADVVFLHCDEQNNSRLHLEVITWGRPCTFKYSAALEELQQIGTTPATPISITDAKYESDLDIKIPKNCTYWKLTGKTIDFNDFSIIKNGSFQDFIIYSNTIDDGLTLHIIYKIHAPL